MRVTKIFSSTGEIVDPVGVRGDGFEITGNRDSIWMDMQNTRDDKAILLIKWDGNGDFIIRCHGIMDQSTDDIFSHTGGIVFSQLLETAGDDAEASVVMDNTSPVDEGPFGLVGQGSPDWTMHAYIPKLPRMKLQIRVQSGTPTVDAWFIA